MIVKLIAHTRLSREMLEALPYGDLYADLVTGTISQRAAVALMAIRTCYSPTEPSQILATEGSKYFGKAATDGQGGTDADRLLRHIVQSGHTSTLEHITYTFAIEGISRSLLAQLTRHRVGLSYSVQSQRYVKFGSKDKSGGFDYVMPPSMTGKDTDSTRLRGFDEEEAKSIWAPITVEEEYEGAMKQLQSVYDRLRRAGVPAEDARYVLPNGATCNLVMTGNLRALLEFYGKRNRRTHAQWEIANLAELIREAVVAVDPWVERFFETAETKTMGDDKQ